MAYVYGQKNPKKVTQLKFGTNVVHESMFANFLSNKRSATRSIERLHHSNSHNIMIVLLLCSGDIQTNPGPGVKATYFSKRLKARKRVLLSRLISVQKKYIESMLHGQFLRKYAEVNVPPPGLKFKKTAQIRHNHDLNTTWEHVLQETSLHLNQTLIKSHNRNAVVLAKKRTALYHHPSGTIRQVVERRRQVLSRKNHGTKDEKVRQSFGELWYPTAPSIYPNGTDTISDCSIT